MNYQVEHRKYILNQYLITKNKKKDIIPLNKKFVELHNYILNSLPKNEFISTMKNNLIFYGNSTKHIICLYNITTKDFYVDMCVWKELSNVVNFDTNSPIRGIAKSIVLDSFEKYYNIDIVNISGNDFSKIKNYGNFKNINEL